MQDLNVSASGSNAGCFNRSKNKPGSAGFLTAGKNKVENSRGAAGNRKISRYTFSEQYSKADFTSTA
jgi:hypothetical protein